MRHWFGGTATDWTMELDSNNHVVSKGGVALTFYSDRTGGFQYTDLLLNSSETSIIYTGDGTNVPLGQVPEFQGPDDVRVMYCQAGTSPYRFRMPCTDLGSALQAHEDDPDPHGAKAYADSLIADLGTAAGSPGPAHAVVFASGYPTSLKSPAGTYVFHCDGTADQVEINAAIDAVTAAGGGDVYLCGPLFRITAPIQITSGLWLHGQGPMTELRANASFEDAIIKNKTVDDHMTVISDLFINGAGQAVHGILLDNTGGDLGGKPTSSPDAAHWIRNLFIRAPGSSSFPGHGIILRGNNNRASKVESCRIQDVSGVGVWVNGASDHHLQNVEVGASGVRSPAMSTSPTGPIGQGFYVDGGNSMLTQCKAFYSRHDGFLVRSARTQLTGCQAQDNYGYGFNSSGGKGIFSGCVADSNGQGEGANGMGVAGFRLNGPNQVVSGCSAFDRGGQSWKQEYGFHVQAGFVNSYLHGVTYGNGTASILGSPNASNDVNVVADVDGK